MPKKYHIAITPTPPSIHTDGEEHGPVRIGKGDVCVALSALNANVWWTPIISAPSIQPC